MDADTHADLVGRLGAAQALLDSLREALEAIAPTPPAELPVAPVEPTPVAPVTPPILVTWYGQEGFGAGVYGGAHE